MSSSNQSPDYSGHNNWISDPFLQRTTYALPQRVKERLEKHGEWTGNFESLKLGRIANQHPPELFTHDAKGERLDTVEFHPSWHALMRKGIQTGLHSSLWNQPKDEQGKHNLTRSSILYMTSSVETGHLCPLVMTSASVTVLLENKALMQTWLPKLLSDKYDPTQRPASKKRGVLIGMGMTEREGGSDLRSIKTRAVAAKNKTWIINGQKWFMSAPMLDAFLVLAQMKEGVGCFLVPRLLPDGKQNGIQIVRLKDKLGNRSNASCEIEFHNSEATLVGEPGRGIKTIMKMVAPTRLDCAVSSTGMMRASLAEAVHHCKHRTAFGDKLIDQPLMERVLADMALDVAGSTALCMRLASAYDQSQTDEAQAAYARLMTPVAKYWSCKMAPALIHEAMECLGGNGYSNAGNLARNYREAPLNAIWEGAGNIMCLDLLRVISQGDQMLELVLSGLQENLGGEAARKTIEVIRSAAKMSLEDPGTSRILIEQLALTAATAELARLNAGQITDVFQDTRLGGIWRNTYGMLDARHNTQGILEALFPDDIV